MRRWRDRGGGVPTAIITRGNGPRAQAACALDFCRIDNERGNGHGAQAACALDFCRIDIIRAVGGAHSISFAWEEAIHIHGLQDVSAAVEVSKTMPDQLSEHERAIPASE
jgi:hypothetical protein